jgi:Zinc dependent phospholipase C
MRQSLFRGVAALALLFYSASPSFGYSVLTHEAIIDSVWGDSLQPLIIKRFPEANAEQLREAYAHAYGGALIQDLGYYPFGSKLFTDLTHYVRSGDFIEALLKESRDINEYAFALGALAHYAADNVGHSMAVNHVVPKLYPKLRAKYGAEVTYDENPTAHLRTEFGFDVLQVARGRYAPADYRNFIGFKVSKHALERAFKTTYALELKDVFADPDLAIGSYRRAASVIIPKMTQVAWETKKGEIEKLTPGITREKFIYNLAHADYEREWGKQYDKPDFEDKLLAFFIRIIPRVGPLKTFSFKPITPETERLFLDSFEATLKEYRALLRRAQPGRFDLVNMNFDLGRPTRAGGYRRADEAYGDLLTKLAKNEFNNVTPGLSKNILAFFGDLNAPIATKKDSDDWRKIVLALDKLKATQAQTRRTVRR